LTQIRKLVSDKLKKSLGERESMLKAKSQQLLEVARKTEKLEERLMNEEIEASTFKKLVSKILLRKGIVGKGNKQFEAGPIRPMETI